MIETRKGGLSLGVARSGVVWSRALSGIDQSLSSCCAPRRAGQWLSRHPSELGSEHRDAPGLDPPALEGRGQPGPPELAAFRLGSAQPLVLGVVSAASTLAGTAASFETAWGALRGG